MSMCVLAWAGHVMQAVLEHTIASTNLLISILQTMRPQTESLLDHLLVGWSLFVYNTMFPFYWEVVTLGCSSLLFITEDEV